MNTFKKDDKVKVFISAAGMLRGYVISCHRDIYLVKVDGIEEPEAFSEYYMMSDLETIRNDKISDLLD